MEPVFLKDFESKNSQKHFPVKSLVVIANPKSIVNKDKCPKVIKQNIYKYDQLSKIIKKDVEDSKKDRDIAEKIMYEIGNFILEHNEPITFNYAAKYSLASLSNIKL